MGNDDNNALSQEQIDALLGGGTGTDIPGEAPVAGEVDLDSILTQAEKDAIGEIGNISMGTAATTLSTLINKKVEITLPSVRVQHVAELKQEFPKPCVVLTVKYIKGFQGNNILFLKEEDAAVMADLMMGGEGKPEKTALDEMSLSAVAESMNQMMGTVATSMSTMIDKGVNISPPEAKVMELAAADIKAFLGGEDIAVVVRFQMKIAGLIESEIVQLQPVSFAKELVESLVSKHAPEEKEAPARPAPPQPPKAQAPRPPSYGTPPPPPPPQVEVQKADFPDFGKKTFTENENRNLDLLLDVKLEITAELGRTKMAIKDILDLGTGSVVELERFAGEPIDVLVNNQLMARAEVVVIDESFGVRITDIISPEERLRNLSKEKE